MGSTSYFINPIKLVSRNVSGMLWLVLAKLDWTLSSSCLTPVSARNQSSGSFPKTVGTLTGEIHQICLTSYNLGQGFIYGREWDSAEQGNSKVGQWPDQRHPGSQLFPRDLSRPGRRGRQRWAKAKRSWKKPSKMLIEHRGLRIEHCSSLNVLITHWQGRQSFIMFCHLARTILILERESKY